MKLERWKDVLGRVALSETQVRRYIKDGKFPPSISVGEKNVAWQSTAIDQWIADRVKSVDLPDGKNFAYDAAGQIVAVGA